MRRVRVLELIFGIASGVLGVVALGWAFFGPLYSGAGSSCNDSGQCQSYTLPPVSIVQSQGLARVLPVIVLFHLVVLGVLVGSSLAVVHVADVRASTV